MSSKGDVVGQRRRARGPRCATHSSTASTSAMLDCFFHEEEACGVCVCEKESLGRPWRLARRVVLLIRPVALPRARLVCPQRKEGGRASRRPSIAWSTHEGTRVQTGAT
jgi:hypothetical protein